MITGKRGTRTRSKARVLHARRHRDYRNRNLIGGIIHSINNQTEINLIIQSRSLNIGQLNGTPDRNWTLKINRNFRPSIFSAIDPRHLTRDTPIHLSRPSLNQKSSYYIPSSFLSSLFPTNSPTPIFPSFRLNPWPFPSKISLLAL